MSGMVPTARPVPEHAYRGGRERRASSVVQSLLALALGAASVPALHALVPALRTGPAWWSTAVLLAVWLGVGVVLLAVHRRRARGQARRGAADGVPDDRGPGQRDR
jgi:hypothetical protein